MRRLSISLLLVRPSAEMPMRIESIIASDSTLSSVTAIRSSRSVMPARRLIWRFPRRDVLGQQHVRTIGVQSEGADAVAVRPPDLQLDAVQSRSRRWRRGAASRMA